MYEVFPFFERLNGEMRTVRARWKGRMIHNKRMWNDEPETFQLSAK